MIADRSWREHFAGFVPRQYPNGSADYFCLDCSEPCEAKFKPEGRLGILTVSRCCGAPVVDEEGWQYESCDF